MERVTYSDFEKLDIRVGTIVSADDFPEARKPAYRLRIDFGELGELKSSAQITKLYQRQDLPGMQVIAVVNFHPKQVGNFMSECLVLGVLGNDGEVTLLQPTGKVGNGSKIA